MESVRNKKAWRQSWRHRCFSMVIVMVTVANKPFDDCQRHKTGERQFHGAGTKCFNRFGQYVQKYRAENCAGGEACQRGLMANEPALGKKSTTQAGQTVEDDGAEYVPPIPVHLRRVRVRAALRAAATRPAGPLVRTAFLAAAFKEPAPRLWAAERVCCASAGFEAAARPSRRSAGR